VEYTITQDDMGTHLDWKHHGVTAEMIDWFWSNMEKGFILWHPEEHEPLVWEVPPKHGNPIHSIHLAPQTWSDGTRQNLYIRFEDPAEVDAKYKDLVIYEHAVIVSGLGFGPESMQNPDPMGYRIHQWEKTDYGVKGRSSGIGLRKKETHADGRVWAAHAGQEVGNWGVFLPQLFELWKVVKNTDYNPFTDLSMEGKGADLRYKYIKR